MRGITLMSLAYPCELLHQSLIPFRLENLGEQEGKVIFERKSQMENYKK